MEYRYIIARGGRDQIDEPMCSFDLDLAVCLTRTTDSTSFGLTKMLLPDSGLNLLVAIKSNGSEYGILFLTDEGDVPIHIDQLKRRAVLAFGLSYMSYCTPKLFRMALSTLGLDVSSYKHMFDNGTTILHAIARIIGRSSSDITNGRMDRIHRKIYYPPHIYVIKIDNE